ncbi:MAG TPA: SBBP repeat-containing protein, partial [bacterium]|nr:SBBP repeat-containing protein [bacterium]
NIFVTGYTYGSLDGNTSAGNYDIFLTKWNSDGAKEWTKQWGTSSGDYAQSVAVNSSGNIFVTGYTAGSLDGNTNAGGGDIFLTKWNSDGTKQWTKQWGTSSDESGRSVAVDSSGNIFVTGSTQGSLDGNTSAGGTDIFLTKWFQ